MDRRIIIAAATFVALLPLAADAMASQGPGVSPGGASAAAQWTAGAMIAALAAIIPVGLVLLLLGRGNRPY